MACTLPENTQATQKNNMPNILNDKNKALRALWESTHLTQEDALALLNAKQVREVGLSTFKAYMAPIESKRRRNCPDCIFNHAKKVFKKHVTFLNEISDGH
jgi:hypothetical protein